MKTFLLLLPLFLIIIVSGCTNYGGGGDNQLQQPPPPDEQKIYEIEITSTGFSPSSVTIKAGDAIKFINNGDTPRWPASNPHPIHTDYPGFDAKQPIRPDNSYSFTFNSKGTFGYHDHLNPTIGGTITVI